MTVSELIAILRTCHPDDAVVSLEIDDLTTSCDQVTIARTVLANGTDANVAVTLS